MLKALVNDCPCLVVVSERRIRRFRIRLSSPFAVHPEYCSLRLDSSRTLAHRKA
ncbi:hypothetical protein COLO4_04486 [Corchorus olitorius]|uniref:Uncharacterized protein n=1 Tax=Corchorus olitorius TaxID=93759 RepID=A0A1R3KTR7_9ROSI|nr:hypothetical protein COLO4_04486 [Corchorus olitorius]